MTHFIPRLNIKTGLLFCILFIPEIIFGQSQKGKVLSSETNSGIGFVNIGIVGKNVGTVSDESGNFIIWLDSIYNNDSLRFSMIGYKSKSLLVGNFKENTLKEVYLIPILYSLQEVNIIYLKPKEIRLGFPVISDDLRTGFSNNDLGSEMGINVLVKGAVKVKDLNLNVAVCTFDSVTYRLNIYQSADQTEYKNILNAPIYISFSKDMIKKVITFDLSKYSIIIEGNVLITLELFKDLGEGSLLFHTQFFTGTTFHKKTSEGKWTEATGQIGMYIHGLVIR
jgi:hypothetical protein